MILTGIFAQFHPVALQRDDSAIQWPWKGATVIFLWSWKGVMQSQWVLSCVALGLTFALTVVVSRVVP